MSKYRRKPDPVRAFQLTPAMVRVETHDGTTAAFPDLGQIPEWAHDLLWPMRPANPDAPALRARGKFSVLTLYQGSYLVLDGRGFVSCPPARDFEARYEPERPATQGALLEAVTGDG